MLISSYEFDQFKTTGLRSFLTFDDFDSFPDNIQTAIKVWLNVRQKACGDHPVQFSEKIYAIPLLVYKSNEFAKVTGRRSYFTVGDAAFGVPYFRALNNGLICGTMLAKAIYGHTSGEYSREKAVKVYSKGVHKLADAEIKKAKSKRKNISYLTWFTQLSSILPFQVIRWSSKNIKRFYELPDFCRR